ncbi:MAG: DUF3592 domain-containing protein [Planctomycetota bacterium]|nr:DUF3592 domain-containing protein [Planctomycetota bacterium]
MSVKGRQVDDRASESSRRNDAAVAKRNRSRLVKMMASGCIAVSSFVILFALGSNVADWLFTRNAESVEGTVVEIDTTFIFRDHGVAGETKYAPVVDYRAEGGQHSVRGRVASNPSRYANRDAVTVLYGPGQPQEGRIQDDIESGYAIKAWLAGSGLLFLIIGLWLFTYSRKMQSHVPSQPTAQCDAQ